MPSFRIIPVIGLWLAFIQVLVAATYEVAQYDPRADDNGPGAAQRPWKTISRAAAKGARGDVVVIRDGVYRQGAVVKRSGTAEAPIRFVLTREALSTCGCQKTNFLSVRAGRNNRVLALSLLPT